MGIEFLHRQIGLQNFGNHVLINWLLNLVVLCFVIPNLPNVSYKLTNSCQNHFVIAWVAIRCLNKQIKHIYNTYCALDLKFTFYPLEFCRTTSFYIIYLVEYALMNILVIEALPTVKPILFQSWEGEVNSLDSKFFYILFLCFALPHFLSTYIELHKKRQKTLIYAWNKTIKQ